MMHESMTIVDTSPLSLRGKKVTRHETNMPQNCQQWTMAWLYDGIKREFLLANKLPGAGSERLIHHIWEAEISSWCHPTAQPQSIVCAPVIQPYL